MANAAGAISTKVASKLKAPFKPRYEKLTIQCQPKTPPKNAAYIAINSEVS
jgi:hypothetical protein